MTEAAGGIVVLPTEGQVFAGSTGATFILKAAAADTAGGFSLMTAVVPGGLPSPAPHIHRSHTEAFYVLAGEMSVLLGERTVLAAAGSLVLVPSGVTHTYGNPSDREARCLIIGSPGGLEGLFEAFARLAKQTGNAQLDPKLVAELGSRYDTEYHFG